MKVIKGQLKNLRELKKIKVHVILLNTITILKIDKYFKKDFFKIQATESQIHKTWIMKILKIQGKNKMDKPDLTLNLRYIKKKKLYIKDKYFYILFF